MNRIRFAWESLRRRQSHFSQEPGAALFQGLRIRLTLWYCGVLGAALVLFSVALYLGAQHFLITPVEDDTAAHAHAHVDQWLTISPYRACSSFGPPGQFVLRPGQGFFMPEMVACFDQNGSLLPGGNTTVLPAAFLDTTLAKTVLQTGEPASDMVDAGGTVGQIYRYAQAVPSPTGSGNVGVVVIGESLQAQESALSLLLMLLLSVGGVALL